MSGGEFEVVLLDAALSGLTLEQADLVDVAVSQGDPRPGVAGVTALGLVEDLAVDAVAVRGDVDCIPAGSLRASSSPFAEGNRVRKSSAGLTTANALTLQRASDNYTQPGPSIRRLDRDCCLHPTGIPGDAHFIIAS